MEYESVNWYRGGLGLIPLGISFSALNAYWYRVGVELPPFQDFLKSFGFLLV